MKSHSKKLWLQLVEKVCFFKKVLVLNPYPQTPFPGKGAILLGLPPLDPVGGYAPATPFLYNQEVYLQTESHSKKLWLLLFTLILKRFKLCEIEWGFLIYAEVEPV